MLIDTNILIYQWDERTPDKKRTARAVLTRLAEGAGRLSTQVLGEFFCGVTRSRLLDRQTAGRTIEAMAATWLVHRSSVEITLGAVRGSLAYGFSYWDAQLWATALVNEIPLILTEDFSDGCTIEGVRFANPFADGFDLDALLAEMGVEP